MSNSEWNTSSAITITPANANLNVLLSDDDGELQLVQKELQGLEAALHSLLPV